MFQVSTFQWNVLIPHKQTEEHKIWYFSSKAIFKTISRMENIGQIYYKHKIYEILNCDMTKALEQNF